MTAPTPYLRLPGTARQVLAFYADVFGCQVRMHTLEEFMLSLLGTATPATMRGWFARLVEGGRVVADLDTRPWGASDGQVVDKYSTG